MAVTAALRKKREQTVREHMETENTHDFDATLETCEDVDLCARLTAAGHRLVSDDRLRSVHLGDPPTLRALFFAELWRGRDNLRTGLRRLPAWRDVPSLLIPVVDLTGLALLAGGAAAASVQPSSSTRLAIRTRLFGQVRALRWSLIRCPPWGWVARHPQPPRGAG